MKKIINLIIPIAAGFILIFFAIPTFGGDLNFFIQKLSTDWEIPLLAAQILLSLASALVLTILFNLLAKIALWLAIAVVLATLFAPALLSNLPSSTEEVKEIVEQNFNL